MSYTITLTDPCPLLSLTVTASSSPADRTYNVGYANVQDTFTAFTLTPASCTVTYGITLDPVPSDLTIATIDSASRTITYGTSDLTHVAVYRVKITAYDSAFTEKASMTY